MDMCPKTRWLVATSALFLVAVCRSVDATGCLKQDTPQFCSPLIIGHGGASGYVPEHTLGSYALAVTLGADYVEPDLVITRDHQLIARHENDISATTDVAERAEFAPRRATKTIDGKQVTGWFTEDFTLDEIKSLRARERIPETRPGNARLDGAFQVPTLQEIIDLVQSLQVSQRRVIGVYPEIKHSTYFKRLGLPMEQLVADVLHKNGYVGPEAAVFIQSFEIDNLKELRNMTELRLLQLLDSPEMRPADQDHETGITYAEMATRKGLQAVGQYASAVGPEKSYVIPLDAEGRLLSPTSFVRDAHDAGLKVHPYTFRREDMFLPLQFRSGDAMGDMAGELRAFVDAGVDGLFTDQPDVAARLRGPCL
ncbi:glycerophosphodiester phosphodiesterase GDPD6 [Plutella xylostella]|uniref:glycerophosphodiester phosphodiesterase GDPD6 n=1 Tax=Plutella xylostella TaxID=51655 RepID=UPI0020324156|nr:glycerophosphodiester phosphodiesterase GDPD6 [Plutella xylostella]